MSHGDAERTIFMDSVIFMMMYCRYEGKAENEGYEQKVGKAKPPIR